MNLRKATPRCLRLPVAVSLILALGIAPTARAFLFELGEAKGSFDTTISVGSLFRLNAPDPNFYGLANGGLQRSVNADDGDLNYKQGFDSFLVKANHDLLIKYQQAGLFVRGFYFNDLMNSNGVRPHTQLTDQAQKVVGAGAELLDAYAYFNANIGSMPVSFRVGRQVLSWGESTFIPNGVNSINPIDVAKLRTPGSELKEALRPLMMASGSITLTESLSAEAFYLFDWQRTRIDPPGTYFSTNDFVAQGGTKVYLGFGAIGDSSGLGAIYRGTDREPGNAGQYGLNLKWLAHGLGDTEFGLYYMNYHSRLPVISAMTPTVPVNGAKVVSDSAAALLGNAAFMGGLVPSATAAGVPPALALQVLIGASLGDPTATQTLAVLTPLQALLPTVAGVTGQIGQRELLVAAATGQYIIEFPPDIHLWGASFNTSVKGVAIQGEISYRDNQPLQVDDVELLFAALSPLSARFGANNQLGAYALNTYIPGFRRTKVWTGQMTATKVTRGFFGADQSTFIGEVGFVKADLPSKSTLRFDGSGTFVGGDINYMNNSGSNASGVLPLSEPASAFADTFSWGYQLVGRLDYNNAFKGVNVSPLLVFSHDVGGNTPLPMGNFIHGRKTITLGADFNFQDSWGVELRYVSFFGAGRYNLLSDRDYVSCNLKYSF
ncbi:DUF1302 domain-containing protein [Opitutus sp. GAS368]|jgi:hypothetical protein|uniref:DUF1302 domain-containing protein n=1 Tax=Opitutus sp. GAS368 TaxID=1882749 RepID=UPI00087C7F6A|nr:DUF1302 domain-containing protein [Opitutus sp. GAS368]SDS56667.1 Protein of unknown function [Opitutus sp. GAS368]